jgi:membrane-associated phospholipid phosphatase
MHLDRAVQKADLTISAAGPGPADRSGGRDNPRLIRPAMPAKPNPLHRARRHPGDALLLGVGAVVTLLGVALQSWHSMNLGVFLEINHWGPEWARFWSALSVIGLGSSAFALAGAAGPRAAREMAGLVGLVLLGTLVTQGLKFGLQAPRPLAMLGPGLVEVVGEALRSRSMPSGHAFTAFSVLSIAWLGTARRWEHAVALAVLATAIGVSRTAVGAHWPSDVMVGSGLGIAVAVLTWHLVPVRRLAPWLIGTTGRRVVAVLLAGTALSLLAGLPPQGLPALGLRPMGYPLARPVQALIALAGFWGAWRWWRDAHPVLPAWDRPGRLFHGLAAPLTLVGGLAAGPAANPAWANRKPMGRPDFAPQRSTAIAPRPVPATARMADLAEEPAPARVWDLDRFRRPQNPAATDPVPPQPASVAPSPAPSGDAPPQRLPRKPGQDPARGLARDLARYARPVPVRTVDAPAGPDLPPNPDDPLPSVR